MKKSGIEWTDATWSPVTGCTKVSAGCKNCYAEREVESRWSKNPKSVFFGRPFTDVQCHFSALALPLAWKKPRRIFVCPRGDLFHHSVPESFIRAVFATMASAPQHTFQVLTKRAHRMHNIFYSWALEGLVLRSGYGSILPNVWLGVSIEDQKTANERIPFLLQTPAIVRWVSAEPLISEVNLRSFPFVHGGYNALSPYRPDNSCTSSQQPKLDWVVCGGESGSLARPMHPDWVRSLRDQCEDAGVPFLFKQWGEWMLSESGVGYARVGVKKAGRLLDGKLHDEYPSVAP